MLCLNIRAPFTVYLKIPEPLQEEHEVRSQFQVMVAAGDEHTCAVTSIGDLVCFGEDHVGQCRVPPDAGSMLMHLGVSGIRWSCQVVGCLVEADTQRNVKSLYTNKGCIWTISNPGLGPHRCCECRDLPHLRDDG